MLFYTASKSECKKFSELDESFLKQDLMQDDKQDTGSRQNDEGESLVSIFNSKATISATEELRKKIGMVHVPIKKTASAPDILNACHSLNRLPSSSSFKGSPEHKVCPPKMPKLPHFVYIWNISYKASRENIFCFFGGEPNVKDIYLYKTVNNSFAGDCLIWVQSRKSLYDILNMNHGVLFGRKLGVVAVNHPSSNRYSIAAMAEEYQRNRIKPLSSSIRKSSFTSLSPSIMDSARFVQKPFPNNASQDVRITQRRTRFSGDQSKMNVNTSRSQYSTPPLQRRPVSRFSNQIQPHPSEKRKPNLGHFEPNKQMKVSPHSSSSKLSPRNSSSKFSSERFGPMQNIYRSGISTMRTQGPDHVFHKQQQQLFQPVSHHRPLTVVNSIISSPFSRMNSPTVKNKNGVQRARVFSERK